MPHNAAITSLQGLNKLRRNYVREKMALANRINGTIASEMGYHSRLNDDKDLYKKGCAVGKKLLSKKPTGSALHLLQLKGFIVAWQAIDESIKDLEKQMVVHAKKLPIFQWSVGIPGLGATTLAKLVAEIGNLDDYSNPAKVWARMGCGVLTDGTRQRKVKGEMTGYDPMRRSEIYLAAQWIVMKGKEPNHPLYVYFVMQKERALPKCKSKKHAELHANRLMGKKLLKWMWREWRSATKQVPVPVPVLVPVAKAA